MHTLQIAEKVLDGYHNEKLTEDRIDFLKTQANEQLDEISQNKALYDGFLNKVNPPEKIDKVILWMLLMLDEDIVEKYIDECGKNFREIIPVSDLADLLIYAIHLKKLQNVELDGFEFLLEYEHPGIEEVDQFAFTNVLLYVEKSKQVQIQF
ncbi:hypothetical protein ACFLR3_04030 [Campylobacterota bacterium]